MYIIVQSFDKISQTEGLDIKEKIALSLKHGGTSIALTSLTDWISLMVAATTVSMM